MPDATAAPSPSTCSAASRSGALRPFLAALVSLPRRPWSWTWPAASLLLAAWVSAKATWIYPTGKPGETGLMLPPYDGLFFSTFMFACAVGTAISAVTGHFVQLLSPPRGHVVPNLRRSALAAMICYTAALLVIPALLWPHPAVVGPAGAIDIRLHALTLAAFLAAQLAWLNYAPAMTILGMFGWWSALGIRGNQDAFLQMLAGQEPMLERVLLVTAGLLFAGLWFALGRRRDRTYQNDPIAEAIVRRFRRAPRSVPAAAPAFPGTIPALVPPGSFTPRARRRLHRHAAGAGTPAAGAGLLGALVLILWMLGYRIFAPGEVDAAVPRLLCFMAGLVPLLFVAASAMENRNALLAHGLLLPIRRADFVRELGLAVLANQYIAWICAVAPVLVVVPFLMPANIRPTPRSLVPIVCVAAAYQLLAFGAIAWALRWQNRFAITLALAGLCGVGCVAMFDFGVARTLDPAWLTVTVVVALASVGVITAFTAYRRWANSEPPSFGPSKTAATL
jgi:hypothetical protein